MNPQHLAAFVWLRHRLLLNQLRRGGLGNRVVLAFAAAGTALGVAGLFVGGLLFGAFGMPELPPVGRLAVWDALIVAFTFVRLTVLLGELQRTDGVSPGKYLHLPVSPAGAFVVNYASSLASFSLAFFTAGTVGLGLGQALAGRPLALLTLPLLAAFVFAATAVGDLGSTWIAALAATPRRRQALAMVGTLLVVGLAQAPGLAGAAGLWKTPAAAAGGVDRDAAEAVARAANLALPPGWLALGAAGLADGAVVPALLGGGGLTLVGVGALRLSYRGTLRLIRGTDAGAGSAAAGAKPGGPATLRFAEWRLPGVPEPAAAVALAGVRLLLRDPTAKASLLAPVMMIAFAAVGLYGVSSRAPDAPAEARPVVAFAAVTFVLVMSSALLANQFGFDRAGFRGCVLSPAGRRDVLLGKNLAAAPFALALAALGLAAVSLALPPRPDHLLAALAWPPALYLLFCLPCNLTSVLAPIALPVPGGKPPQFRTLPVLAHFSLLGVLPLLALPLLLPFGLEFLLEWLTGRDSLPVALPLTLVMLAGAAALYRAVLPLEGKLLAAREQAVLAEVVSKSE